MEKNRWPSGLTKVSIIFFSIFILFACSFGHWKRVQQSLIYFHCIYIAITVLQNCSGRKKKFKIFRAESLVLIFFCRLLLKLYQWSSSIDRVTFWLAAFVSVVVKKSDDFALFKYLGVTNIYLWLFVVCCCSYYS